VLEKEPHNEAVLLKLASSMKKGEIRAGLVTLDRLLAFQPGDPILEAEKSASASSSRS